MLHGIDISNWQKGINVPESLDFCICKATEGFRYVDPYCDGFVQQCVSKGILFGFYHFARNNDPEKEAVHFRTHTKGYELIGVPVLDIEDESIENWGAWAQRFVDKYHAITGVYPMIYASASTLSRFSGYPLTNTCGLWIAGYPTSKQLAIGEVPDFPYSVSPWKFAAIWQYSAHGTVPGWGEHVDLDVAYMDRDAWKSYANPNAATIGQTQVMPAITAASQDTARHFHLGNDKIQIDVTIKE
jgi:GH25 family lysozyme M1 (1,4-beta-N-acetylmuramidase)